MKSLLYLGLLAVPIVSQAELIYMKDGKIHSGREIRRDGNFLFLKVANPSGAPSEILTPLNQVERVDFGDFPALSEARQLAQAGDALGVLEKTTASMIFFRGYVDVPGNQWTDVMRLRLPALAVTQATDLFADLQKQWTPTGDADLDTTYRLLAAAKSDPLGARTAWAALAKPGANTLAAGVSWLSIGSEALAAKEWKAAIKAFLSVEVFIPGQRLLQPHALLGAAQAFVSKGDKAKATALIEEVKTEYPAAAKAASQIIP